MLETSGDFPVAVRRFRNGLFGAHLDRFAKVLAERGYAKFSAWYQPRLLSKFDRWLVQEAGPKPGRYRPTDQLLAFLEGSDYAALGIVHFKRPTAFVRRLGIKRDAA